MADTKRNQTPNHLIAETSPYLLQHAHNPVAWYPWGEEALERARAEDKPILLSVGYSACHWCHVMAHESFEDPETAALMNNLFVNIKVDREERPDIDAIYMEAVQTMTGRGGWPMTVFLTPDGRPFYGGTYYPSSPRYGMPSFQQVLHAISDAWDQRRDELESAGDRLADALRRSVSLEVVETSLPSGILDQARTTLLSQHDTDLGGFDGAPKFPQPTVLDFLLHHYVRSRNAASLLAATRTLTHMANGGIYDQLGGGFHRYSTDAIWLVPHFEKMLYDNAQLALCYLHAWQIGGDAQYRRIAEETLDYLLREMTSSEGGFFSSQDADSDGEEGRFFLWTSEEIDEVLAPDVAQAFRSAYGVTSRGNFPEGGTGSNILHVAKDVGTVAAELGIDPTRLSAMLSEARCKLQSARDLRSRPGRDEKVLAEWNGLAIRAFAEVGAALGRDDYVTAAERAASFVTDSMAYEDDTGLRRLHRTYKDHRARLDGYLEDYASLGLGFVALYESTFDVRWLNDALALTETITERFGDSASGGFFQTSSDHEKLIVRRKDFVDNAIPSGNSLAAELLLHLGHLLDRDDYVQLAEGIVSSMARAFPSQPLAFGRMLSVLETFLFPGPEIAIAGDLHAADTRSLMGEIRKRFMPGSIVAWSAPDDTRSAVQIPLLAGRDAIQGRATAYVCRERVCRLPVSEPEALAAQLDELWPTSTHLPTG